MCTVGGVRRRPLARSHAHPSAEPSIVLSRILLFAVFVVVPAIEIALFIVVGEIIGVLPTVLLVFATAIIGVGLARRQGFDTLQRLKAEMERDRVPGEEIGNAVVIVIAGMLLITPGFFTDTLGLLLFVPALRRAMWRWLRTALKPVVVTGGGAGWDAGGPAAGPGTGPARGDPPVIDLDRDDFGPPRSDTPWRPGDDGSSDR